jgi:hypothetical protein
MGRVFYTVVALVTDVDAGVSVGAGVRTIRSTCRNDWSQPCPYWIV